MPLYASFLELDFTTFRSIKIKYFSPEAATKGCSIIAVSLSHNFYIKMILLPRDAMHKRGYCRHVVSVRLSINE